jgi:hypothetical protein
MDKGDKCDNLLSYLLVRHGWGRLDVGRPVQCSRDTSLAAKCLCRVHHKLIQEAIIVVVLSDEGLKMGMSVNAGVPVQKTHAELMRCETSLNGISVDLVRNCQGHDGRLKNIFSKAMTILSEPHDGGVAIRVSSLQSLKLLEGNIVCLLKALTE